MLAALFFIFSATLFTVRLAKYDTLGTYWVGIDIIAVLFMIFAVFFFIFAPVTVATQMPANIITTTTMEEVPVNSTEFIMLITFATVYTLLGVIFAIRDFILRREAFPNNLAQR
jgi:predicted secreted protein